MKFTSDGRAIHPCRLEDVLRDLLEVGEEHPNHDRQIAEAEDQDQAAARVQQTKIPVD
jgi:hypothetical protein